MTREEALNVIWLRCQHNDKTYEAYCVLKHEQQPCDDATLKDIFCMGCEYKEQQPCDKCVYSTSEGCQYDDITEAIPPFETSDDAISRQAALDALSHMMDTDGFRDGWAVSRANVDCMLRSLPPVTPQLCEDAVSRKAVLKYIEGSEAELGHSSENELVCQDIKELPPVTPQPKMGHWIGRGGSYICSCCRCDPLDFLEPEGLDGGSYMDTPMNYCPHCGIKMVEPQAESEK